MSTFVQDTKETPVLFRCDPYGPVKNEVTAVFPCEPAHLHGYYMTCYAHIGQHSSCDYGWYKKTRPATPKEYADLKQELESAPYGYQLKIYQRINSTLRNKFIAEQRRIAK